MHLRRLLIAYFLVQAAALAAFWLLMWIEPPARGPFVVGAGGAGGEGGEGAFLAFAGADLLLYLPASIAAAVGLARHAPWLPAALWLNAGVALYAALYAVTLAALEPSRWLGALMMAPALVVPPAAAWTLGRR